MAGADDYLPDDTDALKAALTETRAKLVGAQALIEHLQLVIAKMQREKFGPRSERSQRLVDQLELQLEELAAGKRREASTVIVLADFGIGWIAQLSLLTSAKLDVGLCSASSMTRPPDVD